MSFDLIRRAAEKMAAAPAATGGKDETEPAPPVGEAAGRASLPERLAAKAADAAPGEPAAGDAAPIALPPPKPDQAAAKPAAGRRRAAAPALALDLARLRRLGMVTPDSDERAVVEEFRRIKRPLLRKALGDERASLRNGHLIMVGSAAPGEGKSFVAANLALSLASERDINVLLVDADLRRPSLPDIFGFSAERGLVDVLADPALPLSEVMLRTDLGNLSLLPAGKRHPQAQELLASQRMAELIEDIARRYGDRVVVFDSPPVLASSAPAALIAHVGQVLFVVEADRTPHRAIEEALTLVRRCPAVSLLLNRYKPILDPGRIGL